MGELKMRIRPVTERKIKLLATMRGYAHVYQQCMANLVRHTLWEKTWVRIVVLPFFLACVYFLLIASDRYVSEAKVIIKQSDNIGQMEQGFSLLGAATAPGMLDAQLLRQYTLSLDMLHHLEERLSLRAHYQLKKIDIFSRLSSSASQEQFLLYYREHLDVSYDEQAGILTLRVQSFVPAYGQQLMEEILLHGEEFINQIGQRMAREQVRFVEGELKLAQLKLRNSKQSILSFQDEHNLFSPKQESSARLQLVNELEAELTRERTQLNNLLRYMNASSVEVTVVKDHIAALAAQLNIERSKLVGNHAETNLNKVNAQFVDLEMNVEFASDLYKASLMSLEQARIEAYRKLKHLIIVDSPSLAESAEYPRRIYNLITLLVLLGLVYGMVVIVLATIREHKDM